jgi:RNA polymerase sigma-70 factor (ECF subfamily)
MTASPETGALWERSSAHLRAWFERRSSAADAEDLLQETFLRVQERLDTLEDADSVGAWLARIARNAWIDHLRAAGRPEGALEPEAAGPTTESDANLDRTVAAWLEDFLAELEPADAAALRAVDLEGRTQRELAAEQGLSLSGAKSRVQRARARLRQRLEACCALAFDARGGILSATKRARGRCPEGGCGAGGSA